MLLEVVGWLETSDLRHSSVDSGMLSAWQNNSVRDEATVSIRLPSLSALVF